jgi:predicted metal-dependent HD superfamily phosphohydrolase
MSISKRSLKVIGVSDEIAARWVAELQESHRHYHALAHISHIINEATTLAIDHRDVEAMLPTLYAAAWTHDIRYDATRNDNEEVSAEIAKEDLKGTEIDIPLVVDIIIDTKKHEGGTPIRDLFSDLDLLILGSNTSSYNFYMHAIRREFAHVPLEAYTKGRAAVMRSFDERRIFKTDYFAHYEKPAHRNLQREIELLEREPNLFEVPT